MEKYAFIKGNWVIQALFTFAILFLKEKYKCWVEAINIVIAFYYLQEARRLCCPKPSDLNIKLKQDIKPPSIFNLPSLLDSISIKYKFT